MTDQNIVELCLDGNRKAQKVLYDNYKNGMYVVCSRYFSQDDLAEDALHEGFIKVFRDLGQYDSEKGTLGGWVRKVMVNTCLEIIRKNRIKIDDIDEQHDIQSNDPNIISELNLKDLTKLIQLLPDGYRYVFNLFVIEGFSHQEIAQKMNITESTSKSQLFKAKNWLRKRIENILI